MNTNNGTAHPLQKGHSPKAFNGKYYCAVIIILLLANLLAFQIISYSQYGYDNNKRSNQYHSVEELYPGLDSAIVDDSPVGEKKLRGKNPKKKEDNTNASPEAATGPSNILTIPQGEVPNLPSIRIEEDETRKKKRGFYGGEGDKHHLGGFTTVDLHGISPSVWKLLVEYFGIKSVLDIGCGRGISTSWFDLHGLDVQCVEGSHDAVEKSMLPNKFDTIRGLEGDAVSYKHQANTKKLVEHDFSRGPWWPLRTFDAVWAVEFLEHVGRNYQQNYIPAMRKAGFLFVSHSIWGGHHHVEIHDNDWWQTRFESFGFVYSKHLTELIWKTAVEECDRKVAAPVKDENSNDETYCAYHLRRRVQVFINPAVTALPQHHHLMSELGCYNHHNQDKNDGSSTHRRCNYGQWEGTETELPEHYNALQLTDDMDKRWEELLRSNI